MRDDDPRRDGELLKRLTDAQSNEMESPSSRTIRRPPSIARCERCGCANVSALPTFSVGSGLTYRPVPEDIYCHRCGHIAPPALGAKEKSLQDRSVQE
jgi:hypothetical protein